MSAQYAGSNLSFVASRAAPASADRSRHSAGVFARAAQWLLDMPRRRAVINELDALSDHELADIGLARADVPRVFDASFSAQRGV